MANLIKNGDFANQGDHWTATNPTNVSYVNGHCIIATPDSISQDVKLGNGGGGLFMVFARMKTLRGYAGRITVQPIPTGDPVYLEVGGQQQEWTLQWQIFTAPLATLAFKVTAESNDGTFDELGSYFGDITLSKLL
ncbi:hypothetical protein QZR14_00335 [Pseudomonas sp. rhizo66]|uniref:hypothetical protein n=1 Tax=unclassified Pseudomonas TaxID=196821 RepID=UPI002029C01E|nr:MULTISPECIES: hypothetical protein [unclassified Pseudomonas]MCL9800478.1 hypothetical protein [Pseudomonas sp. AKS31]MDT3309791.1 hypothetical protein [Pseudomonas sp. rhizo66]